MLVLETSLAVGASLQHYDACMTAHASTQLPSPAEPLQQICALKMSCFAQPFAHDSALDLFVQSMCLPLANCLSVRPFTRHISAAGAQQEMEAEWTHGNVSRHLAYAQVPCVNTGLWFAHPTPAAVALLKTMLAQMLSHADEWEQAAFQMVSCPLAWLSAYEAWPHQNTPAGRCMRGNECMATGCERCDFGLQCCQSEGSDHICP